MDDEAGGGHHSDEADEEVERHSRLRAVRRRQPRGGVGGVTGAWCRGFGFRNHLGDCGQTLSSVDMVKRH